MNMLISGFLLVTGVISLACGTDPFIIYLTLMVYRTAGSVKLV